MAIHPVPAFHWAPIQASSTSREHRLSISDFPRELDQLVILDYTKWVENDEEGDEDESLLEISAFDASCPHFFSGTPSGIYYIIGYFDSQDLLHEIIEVRQGTKNLDLNIRLEEDGTANLEVGRGIRIITREILPTNNAEI